MALSYSRVCNYLALVRVCGFRKYGATNGQYSRYVACQFRSSLLALTGPFLIERSSCHQILRSLHVCLGSVCPSSALLSPIKAIGPSTHPVVCGRSAGGPGRTVAIRRLSTCRHYSSSTVRHGIGRYVASRLQYANNKYERFLKRRFPRFYLLYHTFMEGSKLLFHDAKDVVKIKVKMQSDGIKFQDLPYREMEKLRQFRRNMIKATPLLIIAIPPFANYLVFVLMYFFPRQLLIPHFWTPKQQVEFRGVYHSLRARHHQPVLTGLEFMGQQVKDVRLKDLCAKVQSGGHPKVSEILAVRNLFSRPPLDIRRMSVDQMRHICPLLFMTPHLPGFLIGRRLKSHALELLQLDGALRRLGPHQLSEPELKQACFIRGLNSDGLDLNQCQEWLSQWLQVSSSLKESEVSLLLHNIALLSVNYPNRLSRR